LIWYLRVAHSNSGGHVDVTVSRIVGAVASDGIATRAVFVRCEDRTFGQVSISTLFFEKLVGVHEKA